jgi:hypothetical protein
MPIGSVAMLKDISFLENKTSVNWGLKLILKHLGLWETKT